MKLTLPSKVTRQGLLLARERNLFLFVHFCFKVFFSKLLFFLSLMR